MELKITTNAIEAKYYFDRVARRQIPFAVSRGINRLAYDARDDEQSLIGYYFDLRTGWLTKKGAMPVVASKKNQWPNIHAILAVADEVAALSATGGIRRPGKGSDMAVPLSDAGNGKSARAILNPGPETLGPRFFPSRIVRPSRVANTKRRTSSNAKPKPFILKGKGGRQYVAQRGKGKEIDFLYVTKQAVKVGQTWPLVGHVSLFVGRQYDTYLAREMRAAIESSM